jgi:hypothetical protein
MADLRDISGTASREAGKARRDFLFPWQLCGFARGIYLDTFANVPVVNLPSVINAKVMVLCFEMDYVRRQFFFHRSRIVAQQ